jgi:hypothetical protein
MRMLTAMTSIIDMSMDPTTRRGANSHRHQHDALAHSHPHVPEAHYQHRH